MDVQVQVIPEHDPEVCDTSFAAVSEPRFLLEVLVHLHRTHDFTDPFSTSEEFAVELFF